MNPYFIIITCALIFAGQAVFFKMFSLGYLRGLASHFLNNVFFLSIVVLIFIAANGFLTAENTDTYIYSSIFGVVWVIAILFFKKAMGMGPTGLVTLFFSFGIIIPIIADLAVLGTLISISQVVGLGLLFLSFYIGNRPQGEEKKSVSLRFIAVCITSMVFNGLILATVKLHQGAMPGVDVEAFVLYGFAVAVLTSVLCFLFFHIRETLINAPTHDCAVILPKPFVENARFTASKAVLFASGLDKIPIAATHRFINQCFLRQSKKEKVSYGYMFKSPRYYLTVAGSGATTAAGNIMMLFAASQVPAAIQFPLMSGGSSIIAAVLSIFIFKEKLTKKMALVFIIGIAALAIINL